MNEIPKDISKLISLFKKAILLSQYKASQSVNTHMVNLYYFLGAIISYKSKKANWGDKILETISIEIKKDLKHLKGFSVDNLKKMRRFYEAYPHLLSKCELIHEFSQGSDIEIDKIGSPVATQFEKSTNEIGSPLATQFQNLEFDNFGTAFWNISFTNHLTIINKIKESQYRAYFIIETYNNSWSKRILLNHIENNIHLQPKLQSNFETVLPDSIKLKALAQFRDEYLLDFISIEDSDDERLMESKIVNNITKFILNLGKGFSFIGNQYRIESEEGEGEGFVDLLFYNRIIKSLIVFELKRGKFKPEYISKLSYYLSILDRTEKLDGENPSIGIILCKEKKDSVVEITLGTNNAAVGVATYKTMSEVPESMRNVLPDFKDLIRLLTDNDD
jgi:predicted nuclease of restriction endonuclease-like (RecB) superfamily